MEAPNNNKQWIYYTGIEKDEALEDLRSFGLDTPDCEVLEAIVTNEKGKWQSTRWNYLPKDKACQQNT